MKHQPQHHVVLGVETLCQMHGGKQAFEKVVLAQAHVGKPQICANHWIQSGMDYSGKIMFSAFQRVIVTEYNKHIVLHANECHFSICSTVPYSIF